MKKENIKVSRTTMFKVYQQQTNLKLNKSFKQKAGITQNNAKKLSLYRKCGK